MPAQDPTERFDLVDEEGAALGVSKARAEVHRDGDWHQSLHLWVVLRGREGGPEGDRVLLQRRSAAKDTHASKVDVSVAGHLRAGESIDDAFREAEEEIGLPLRASDAVRLWVRRSVLRTATVYDRELQHVFVALCDASFEALRPDPDEVAGVLAVSIDALLALVERGESVPARERTATGVRDVTLAPEELVPTPDGYALRAAHAIAALARR